MFEKPDLVTLKIKLIILYGFIAGLCYRVNIEINNVKIILLDTMKFLITFRICRNP